MKNKSVSKKKEDFNQSAFRAVQETIRLSEAPSNVVLISHGQQISSKNPAAVALGRLGGLKGGRARADKLGPERLSQSASKAARARWAKKPEKQNQ